ncbi:MAG: radical SAM protein [Thermodesulfobacteriota bacterium]|nr:radical SAM protein [Thermodesulfobacteriota bacterium]
MKILLVYPCFLEDRTHIDEVSVPPQGLYSVAAVMKANGYDVNILNGYDFQQPLEQFAATLRAQNPDIIGFSILNANRWGGIDMAGVAKNLCPGAMIVFGGIGATYLWNHLLTHFPQIDYVVIGEGEYNFLHLVQHIQTGITSIEDIGGVAYRKNDVAMRNPAPPLIRDLDSLPCPAEHFLYKHVSLARGCPGDCTFCGSPDFWDRRVRFHSADYFVGELETLYRKGIRFFFFSDDTFTIQKKRTIDVCRMIIAKKLSIAWQAISRVDMIDEEILYWMRKSGCIQISYGVESGSKQIRKMLKKNYSADQIENAFSLTVKYGIMSRAYFIYGCPGETEGTIEETIALIKRIKPLSVIFYILDIFPGTELYSDYKKKLAATDDVWLKRIEDILYFETDSFLTQDQVLAFGRKLRGSFYKNLPEFVNALKLVDIEELYPFHADFLSRLAMTFDHGDYAQVDTIPEKEKIARGLYQKAVSFFPDARAYLGLGIQLQKTGPPEASVKLLNKAIEHFPDDEQLNTCLGVSYMNLERYEDALRCFEPFQQPEHVRNFIAECHQRLGRSA